MRKGKIVVVCVALAALSVSASAGMWWARGDPGSTYQDWGFDTPANPAAPEHTNNPGASVSITAIPGDHVPSEQAGWHEVWYGRDGVWAGDVLQLVIDIPNVWLPNPYKDIWLTMEYAGDVTAADITLPQEGATLLDSSWAYSTGGWKIFTIGWRIEPNPIEEQIFIEIVDSGAFLNYLYIDTICYIPEPATLLLLGLGGLMVRRKR